MYKFLVLAAVLAYANAGGIFGAPALATTYAAAPVAYGHAVPAVSTAIGSTQQATLRSLDGNNVISQYSKAVDTAFSSVRKYDTRITNDAQYIAPAVATYAHAAPAVATYAHAAPAVATYAHAAPAVATYAHAAPAVATYAAPAVASYAHAAPVVAARAYAPAVAAVGHAPVAAHAGLLGVAYSAAPAVSHITFDGFGAHYGW